MDWDQDTPQVPTKVEAANNKLNKKVEKIATKIARQQDPDEIKNLVQEFNLAHTKKQIIRSMTYDQLLDHITDQMKERILKRADQFSNKDLLDYLNTMNTAMEKAHKQINEVDAVPAIQFNQQNNTVIMSDGLDRESRERVFDFVKNALNNLQNLENISSTLDISDEITVLNSKDLDHSEESEESFNINFNEE